MEVRCCDSLTKTGMVAKTVMPNAHRTIKFVRYISVYFKFSILEFRRHLSIFEIKKKIKERAKLDLQCMHIYMLLLASGYAAPTMDWFKEVCESAHISRNSQARQK